MADQTDDGGAVLRYDHDAEGDTPFSVVLTFPSATKAEEDDDAEEFLSAALAQYGAFMMAAIIANGADEIRGVHNAMRKLREGFEERAGAV